MAIRKLNQLGLYSAITIPQMNGEAHTLLITHVVKEKIGTADILELAAIPVGAKIHLRLTYGAQPTHNAT